MSEPIFIFGAGGLGREIKAMLAAMHEWSVAGFYDDGLPEGTLVDGVMCLGGVESITKLKTTANFVVAIGDPQVKRKIVQKLSNAPVSFPVIVHPAAHLLNVDKIILGQGTIITAGCILTTDITVEDHVLINLNATVGHDVRIGKYSSIMPGVNIAGQVTIGENVLVGSGANILNGLTLDEHARVGAGAVVTKNVASESTVAGVPAKPMKR